MRELLRRFIAAWRHEDEYNEWERMATWLQDNDPR